MTAMFSTIVRMSITASYVALVVLGVRLLLRKAPRVFSYALWAVVFFRLICPFTFESAASLLPAGTVVVQQPVSQAPATPVVDEPANNSSGPQQQSPKGTVVVLPAPTPEINTAGEFTRWEAAAFVWALGVFAIWVYAGASYIRLKSRVSTAVRVSGRVFETDQINTPFVLGVLQPQIYIPTGLADQDLGHILKHEEVHIKRLDHLITPVAFLSATLHWFNPLAWVSYFLMTQDMEMSCDEAVLRQMGNGVRGSYSSSLLNLSARQSGLLAPLAFGESNVKSRIKNVLNYRQPAFWVGAVAVVAVLVVSVGLISNPSHAPELPNQALVPVMGQEVEENETYLVFDLGTLPKGVTVEAEGFELKPGSGTDAALYQLKLHDVLRVQNTSNLEPFTVRLNFIYSHKGRSIKEVAVAYEVNSTTYLTIDDHLAESTTNDSVGVSGTVAPGAIVTVNGVRVNPETTNRFFCVVPLPGLGDNQIVVKAERLGEATNTFIHTVNRIAGLTTDELKASIGEVTGGIAIDHGANERPVTAAALQNLLREVFSAPIISRPEGETGGGGVGNIIIKLPGKATQLHVSDDYVVLNGLYYRLPEDTQEQITNWFSSFDTPYEWPFRRWLEVLPFEVPQGSGVRTLAIRDEDGPLETLLVVYEEKDDAGVVIDRIVEVAPGTGQFEVHVKKGGTTGRYDAVVIHGWDAQRQFTVKWVP